MNRPHRGGTTTTRAPAAALAPPAGHTVHAVTRRRAGWRRAPFLPLPSMPYVRWRMQTAYGDPDALPSPEDVVRYARWIGRQR